MPTLLSDQRFHHAFHPYQSISQPSRSSLPCRVHHLSPITKSLAFSKSKTVRPAASHLARRVGEKQRSNSPHYSASPAASTPSLVTRTQSPASCTASASLLDCSNKLQSPNSHSFLSATSSSSSYSGSSNYSLPTQSSSQVAHGSSPPEALLATQDRTNSSESSFRSNPTSFECHPTSSSSHATSSSTPRVPSSPQCHRDFVRYLKAWRPPVEYYARRRYQHPSLSYPSRRPSLPSLLEERITVDGNMDVVCPELAMSTSPRACRKRISPARLPYLHSVSQPRSTQQCWDDDLEEDLDSDDDDGDESDYESDSESEVVTPTSSPGSSTTYFLHPLVLTKLPGY